MSDLVANCPRCGAERITFEARSAHYIYSDGWPRYYEVFCICRNCHKSTTFLLYHLIYEETDHILKNGILKFSDSLNNHMKIQSYISLKDKAGIEPPEFLPKEINAAFNEGSKCLAIGCYNAAATMFRLCVDLATRQMLPKAEEEGLTAKVRRDLGLRLPWLFKMSRLPDALHELSFCVKEDGNDGAHQGTIAREDADDLFDFTIALLERLFTEPERLRLAKERRDKRREPKSGA